MSALSLALTFAGSMLGAGYVSGQELYQYFQCYGIKGMTGLVISLLFISVIMYLCVRIPGRTGSTAIDDLVIRWDNPELKKILSVLVEAVYFPIGVVMTSGIVSLGEQLLGLPNYIGAAIAVILIYLCVYFGIDGMVRIFNSLVPILVAAAIIICCIRIGQAGPERITFAEEDTNPLLGGWFFSSVNYACCNIFGMMGVLAAVSDRVKNAKTCFRGIILGGVFLFGVAMAILCAMSVSGDCTAYDLPMLHLSQQMSQITGIVYGVLLFFAMFGNAVATFVAMINQYETRRKIRHKIPVLVILAALTYLFSLYGFAKLVSVIFPFIGYVGIVTTLLIIEHAIHLFKEKRHELF